MMLANRHGQGVIPVGAIETSAESLDRVRDIIMLKLAIRGVSQKAIGKLFRMTQQNVSYRLRVMPAEAKEYYSRLTL